MFPSLPKTLTLPDHPYYPVSPTLELFDRETRATFTTKTGKQADAFDPNFQIKRWWDTRDYSNLGPTGLVEYLYFDPVAHGFKTMKMTQAEAARPNLPGVYSYPKYVIAPTPAVWVHTGPGDSSITPYDASLLCSEDEATEISKEINGGAPAEAPATLGQLLLEWNGETRRNWLIPWNGGHQQASLLLKAKNSAGVGAPGEWNLTKPASGPLWQPAIQQTGVQDARPEIAIPVRALYSQEALAPNFGQVLVIRTDMASPFNPSPTAAPTVLPVSVAGSGVLTDEQMQLLQRIDQNVFQLTQRA